MSGGLHSQCRGIPTTARQLKLVHERTASSQYPPSCLTFILTFTYMGENFYMRSYLLSSADLLCPPGDTIAQTIQELPIPEDVREWDANITRPSVISKPYDIRIPKESIFYIPSTQKYVVSMNCDLCKYQQQRCDRTRPTCKRCKKTGVDCKISNKGYQELPPLKINKGYQELPPLKINKGKRKRAAGEVQSKNKSKRVKVAEATDSESYDEKSITVTRRRQKHFTGKI